MYKEAYEHYKDLVSQVDEEEKEKIAQVILNEIVTEEGEINEEKLAALPNIIPAAKRALGAAGQTGIGKAIKNVGARASQGLSRAKASEPVQKAKKGLGMAALGGGAYVAGQETGKKQN